ncbi:hypothetical protein EHQ96_00050 [Leptospira levettii]|nr:hypothetical protein EHQ96_00050 [Leptospira levettii]
MINCAGTIRFNHSFPEEYKEVANQNIDKRLRIAFFDDEQKINNLNKEEIEYLKTVFQSQNIPFYIEKNRNLFKDYDLIILNYSVSYPDGFKKGMINTFNFISYLQMFLTLGVIPSADYNYKNHQIVVFNPKTQKEKIIAFTEQILKEDGWAPFLFGKFNGEFSEKHKRYLVFKNSQVFEKNLVATIITPEAI